MSEEMLLIGDDAIHGEEAYCFSDDPLIPYNNTEGAPAAGDIEAAVAGTSKSSTGNNGEPEKS